MSISKIILDKSYTIIDHNNSWFDINIIKQDWSNIGVYKEGFKVMSLSTGIKLIVPNDNEDYFNYNEFIRENALGNNTFGLTSMFGSKEYMKYLIDNNIILANEYIKLNCDGTNQNNFVHLKLFELVFSKINIVEYVRWIYKICFNMDLFKCEYEHMNQLLLTELPQNKRFKIGEFMTLKQIYIDPNDCYVACSTVERAAREKYNIPQLSKDAASSSYLTVSSSVYNNYIDYLKNHINCVINSWFDLRKINTLTMFAHPILIIIRICLLNRFSFRNALVKEILDNKRIDEQVYELSTNMYDINMNNRIIKHCKNKQFVYSNFGDTIVVIDTITKFIKLNSLIYAFTNDVYVKQTDLEQQFDYKVKMFLRDEQRFKYTQCLNDNIKNNNLTNFDINDKYLSQLDSINYTTLNDFTYCVQFLQTEEPDYQGYYVHPELFIYFSMYYNHNIAIKYVRLLCAILSYTSLTKTTIDNYYMSIIQKYKEQAEVYKQKYEENKALSELLMKQYMDITNNNKLMKLENEQIKEITEELALDHEELQNKYNKLRHDFEQANPSLGYLKISIANNQQMKIQFGTTPLLTNNDTLKLYTGYDAKKMYDKIRAEIKEHPIDAISYDNHNKFNITDTTKALQYIDDIMNNIYYTYSENKYIKQEYKELVDRYIKLTNRLNEEMNENTCRNLVKRIANIKGFIYEYQCAYDFKLCQQRNISKTFFIENSLTSKDIGFDLIDINNKVLYQCKHYSGRISIKHLQTFFRFRDKLQDYKLRIITNNKKFIPSKVYIGDDKIIDEQDIIEHPFTEPEQYCLYTC